MRKLFGIFLTLTIANFSLPAQAVDKYEFDKSHTHILFYVDHLGFSDMIGEFTSFDGNFMFDPNKPRDSSVNVTIKPSGIRTSSSALDSELQSDHFFNSDQFPEITFESKSIKVTGANTGEVIGNITLLGITKPAVLHVRFNKADYHPFTKDFVAGFSATTTIKRSDFGMNYLIPLVADKVRIEVQTEGINMDRKKQTSLKH